MRCLPIWVVCLASVLAGQEPQQQPSAPPTATPASLPKSTQGGAVGAADAEIDVRHTAPHAQDCKAISTPKGCQDADHWAVEFRWAAQKVVVPTDGAALDKLDAPLAQLAKATAGKRVAGGKPISDAAVSLRIAPNAPWGLVSKVMMSSAANGLPNLEIAVAAGDGKAVQRLPVPLPLDSAVIGGGADAVPAEIRVALLFDEASGKVLRKFGTRIVGSDAELLSICRDQLADYVRINKPDVPGIIEADRRVPWQQVVDVVSAMRAAGVQQIQFASGVQPK